MITANNLLKTFGSRNAVNGVSFALNKGEVVGLLGPNGAGKTTIMRLLTGYLQPDGGSITIDGAQIEPQSHAFKQRIGYLPETVPLYEDLSVNQYLVYFAKLYALENRNTKITQALHVVDLLDRQESLVGNLSKGMRQRLGLARAILHDPDILLLDEPTIGLDPAQVVDIRALIQKLGQTKTVLFSTHILAEAQETCDRLIILREGAVVAEGDVATLAAKLVPQTAVDVQVQDSTGFETFVTSRAWCQSVSQTAAARFVLYLEPAVSKSDILAEIVGQGFAVDAFTALENNLEDIYLDLLTQSS